MDLYVIYYLFGQFVLLVSLPPPITSTCSFPDFVQSGTINRKHWQSGLKSQYREVTLEINVTENKLSVVSTDDSATSYERVCVMMLTDNKFVTVHEEARQRKQQYVCVQFLARSDSVVQLRVSELYGSMSGICEDTNLHIDPWIWVDKNSILESSTICPLTGGYSVKLFDKEYNMGMCDAYKDHVWIESECVAGTGLYFNFRYTRCIPNVLMAPQQHTICLANWTEGGYNFALVRHNTHPYMWILRFPSDQYHLSSFVAYLMKDLYASSSIHLTELDMYVHMDMVQDTAHHVSSLCIDEFEGCSYYGDPCSKGDEMALTCARTCEVCNETRPIVCGFDSELQGDWIDASHGDRVASTFEPQILTVYYNRIKQKFYCIRWDEPYSGKPQKHTTFKMLVTEFANGCRPQYSCVKLIHRASSPVMFLQLSTERHWPFTNSITDPVNCNNFDFDGDDNTLVPNRYRSKHHKLLYSKFLDTGTQCNMPLGDVTTWSVTLSDQTLCKAGLRPSSSGSSVIVILSECNSASSVSKEIPRDHTCVESSRLFTSDLVVISRTDVEPYAVYCWLFPRRTRDIFYLVEAAHCNDNTKRRIARGHLVPLATFSSRPPTPPTLSDLVVPTTPAQTLPESRDILSPSGEHSVIEITPGEENISDSTHSDGNSTSDKPKPTSPASYASPIVIIAAIIFILAFQIPCTCRNS